MKYTIASLFVCLTISAYATTKTVVLHSFDSGTDGNGPVGSLISDAAGNLYGVTTVGGNAPSCLDFGCGIIYELIAPQTKNGQWQEKILYTFTGGADGAHPTGSLVMDGNGVLYGVTAEGGDTGNPACYQSTAPVGCGVVYSFQGGVLTVLHTFEWTDGQTPIGGLALGPDGTLYGVTSTAGGNYYGTAFQIANGEFTLLHEFGLPGDGFIPAAAPTLGPDGTLYGTTIGGGTKDIGTVFSIANGQEQILYNFDSDVFSNPEAPLTFDAQGNLLGTAANGGPGGSVFQLDAGTWQYRLRYNFSVPPNIHPEAGVIVDTAGSIYGTTAQGCGSVWRLSKALREDFIKWKPYSGMPCGPKGGIIFGKFGGGYGTTASGGTSTACNNGGRNLIGCGTVFAVYP